MSKQKQPLFAAAPYLTNEVAAELATLAIFVLWGLNFSATKKCLEYTSPFMLNGLCFGSGGLVVLIIQYKQLRLCDWKAVVIVGFFMCVSTVLQTIALNHTVVAKISFFSTLDIPITAAVEMFSRTLGWGEIFGMPYKHISYTTNYLPFLIWSGVISVLIGAFLLSWDGLAINPNSGDWVAIIATIPSAAYYISSAKYCAEDTKASICVGQLLISSVMCFVMAPCFEVPRLVWSWELIYGLFISGALSCGFALYVLTWAQMYTTATRAVIIGAPEPIFAAIGAYIWYDEGMFSLINYAGSALMLAGVLLPLVNEESRHSMELSSILSSPVKGSREGESHEFPLGHYNNSLHFVHHDKESPRIGMISSSAIVRRRMGPGICCLLPLIKNSLRLKYRLQVLGQILLKKCRL